MEFKLVDTSITTMYRFSFQDGGSEHILEIEVDNETGYIQSAHRAPVILVELGDVENGPRMSQELGPRTDLAHVLCYAFQFDPKSPDETLALFVEKS